MERLVGSPDDGRGASNALLAELLGARHGLSFPPRDLDDLGFGTDSTAALSALLMQRQLDAGASSYLS